MSYAPQGPGPAPSGPGPYPGGQHPYGTAPQQATPQTQAAWRYSARRKNDTTAWLLWIGGPFLIGLPVHDFYFGDIGRGLAKIGLLLMVFVSIIGGVVVSAATLDGSSSPNMPVGIGIGLALAGLCVIASITWWIYDGVTMTKRLENKNNQIRQEIAAEQGIDPWSF